MFLGEKLGSRKASQTLGLVVIALDDGQKVGEVKDLVLDADGMRLRAVTVRHPGILGRERAIFFEDVEAIGEDALTIRSRQALVSKKALMKSVGRKAPLLNAAVLTESGERLGEISDFTIDLKAGSIEELEVSRGLLKDITGGMMVVSARDILTIGANVVIVSAGVEKKSRGGIEETLARMGARARLIRRDATLKEEEYCLGKVAGRTIKGGGNEVIIGHGEVIGKEHIEAAKAEGKLHELALAAGLAVAKEAWDELKGEAKESNQK